MNFKKVAAGVLACTMSMTLFGCELVTVNKERDNAQVVISVGDRSYTKEVVSGMANSLLSMYGIDNANSGTYDEYRMEIANSFASQKALQYYAVQNGYMDKLTDEDNKEIEESFEESKKHYDEEIYDKVKSDLGYTDKDGAPEFDERAQARVEKKVAEERKAYLISMGATSLEDYKNDLTEQKAVDYYTEHLESTVSVSDDEVKAEYDSMLLEQKNTYDSDPGAYIEGAGSDETVVYVPEGLRRVKHVLIKIDQESSDKISALEKEIAALEDGEEKTNKQSELDILKKDAFGKIEEKANNVLNQARGGADFDSLIEKYGEDEGTAANPEGYLMHADVNDKYETNFQFEGMALEKVGDISGLVETTYGYHILMYASDVQSGEVAFDTVREKIKEKALSSKKEKVVKEKTTEIFDGYKADGTVKIYSDRMKTASVPGKD